MAKIHELATVLADQIAAGEVVERPASVVKELVENAIDANSTQIDIYVKEAGIKRSHVIDNGEGIAAEDVPLAFLGMRQVRSRSAKTFSSKYTRFSRRGVTKYCFSG